MTASKAANLNKKRPVLRVKGIPPEPYEPDPDPLRELCGLFCAVRAYSQTMSDQPDIGREHPLYPPNQPIDPRGWWDQRPLWDQIERTLEGHGFGRE